MTIIPLSESAQTKIKELLGKAKAIEVELNVFVSGIISQNGASGKAYRLSDDGASLVEIEENNEGGN